MNTDQHKRVTDDDTETNMDNDIEHEINEKNKTGKIAVNDTTEKNNNQHSQKEDGDETEKTPPIEHNPQVFTDESDREAPVGDKTNKDNELSEDDETEQEEESYNYKRRKSQDRQSNDSFNLEEDTQGVAKQNTPTAPEYNSDSAIEETYKPHPIKGRAVRTQSERQYGLRNIARQDYAKIHKAETESKKSKQPTKQGKKAAPKKERKRKKTEDSDPENDTKRQKEDLESMDGPNDQTYQKEEEEEPNIIEDTPEKKKEEKPKETDNVKSLNIRINKLSNELRDIKETSKRDANKIKIITVEKQRLENDLKTAKRQASQMKEDNRTITQELEKEKKRHTREAEERKKDEREEERQTTKLKSQIDHLKKEKTDMTRQLHELRETIKNLQEKNCTMQLTITDLELDQAELKRLKILCDNLKEKLDEERQENKNLIKQIKERPQKPTEEEKPASNRRALLIADSNRKTITKELAGNTIEWDETPDIYTIKELEKRIKDTPNEALRECDIIVIMLGTNDIAKKMMTASEATMKLIHIAEEIRSKAEVQVGICQPPPMAIRTEPYLNTEMSILASTIEEINIEGTTPIITRDALTEHPKSVTLQPDGIHLTYTGAELIAASIEQQTETILQQNRIPKPVKQRLGKKEVHTKANTKTTKTLVVPERAVGHIVGKKGRTIQATQDEFKVHVSIKKPEGRAKHHEAEVTGQPSNVEKAIEHIKWIVDNHRTREDSTERDQPKERSQEICAFYRSKKGCRNGSRCPFKHTKGTDTPAGRERRQRSRSNSPRETDSNTKRRREQQRNEQQRSYNHTPDVISTRRITPNRR